MDVRRTVCVDGRPFDKHGRCFAHPHVKVASRKILGGWKIHMQFCPLCLNGDDRKTMDGDHGSVVSDNSRLTDGSGFTDVSRHSRKSSRSNTSRFSISSRKSHGSKRSRKSHGSKSSRKSNTSLRSKGSSASVARSTTSSWSFNRSRKKKVTNKNKTNKNNTDDSFLPLDGDGYCLHHPDIQLAKISKKSGWQVIMDFCPECAGQSLAMGGSVGGSRPRKRGTSVTSANSSCKSGKSGDSHSTFIESMPYIDGDGKPGHYTGHVDNEGQPNGRGKMKYISGSKFDGVWHEGTKLHGRTFKKRSSKTKTTTPSSRHPPPPPPMPPPLLPSKKKQSRRSKTRRSQDDNDGGEYKSSTTHRTSRQDTPSRSFNEEDSASSVRPPRRSLSRLRRKCDEIESLLRGYPSSTRDTKLD